MKLLLNPTVHKHTSVTSLLFFEKRDKSTSTFFSVLCYLYLFIKLKCGCQSSYIQMEKSRSCSLLQRKKHIQTYIQPLTPLPELKVLWRNCSFLHIQYFFLLWYCKCPLLSRMTCRLWAFPHPHLLLLSSFILSNQQPDQFINQINELLYC